MNKPVRKNSPLLTGVYAMVEDLCKKDYIWAEAHKQECIDIHEKNEREYQQACKEYEQKQRLNSQ
jgi:hypothetical protein